MLTQNAGPRQQPGADERTASANRQERADLEMRLNIIPPKVPEHLMVSLPDTTEPKEFLLEKEDALLLELAVVLRKSATLEEELTINKLHAVRERLMAAVKTEAETIKRIAHKYKIKDMNAFKLVDGRLILY